MKKLALGTVVYLDGIKSHLALIGGYTTDLFGNESYLFAAALTDGEFELNNEDQSELFCMPIDICDEASDEDKQMFFKKMMSHE